ncbi:energy-coupling factor transporter transmembrane protein EcfT [Nocardiopsis sp. RSe5-2]|uniref:Energy-coupling factor transporter transmembrane protein EcfT n=1 Tax=Nocardiopsis endophytica TaxID=3018445 RepID=A0ABT4U0B0_9ACTN|nr:CbiQ family ECF transporter T component [Nocardiopsis endophytica]MDA2810111.1 energy-coupling factor transporter transmembrane protein EcfT [Nocardiopsis endophytica]
MNVLGLFVPGRSVLHRLPAGAKLLGLLALVTVLVALDDHRAGLIATPAAALACLCAYPATGLGLRRPLRLLLPLLPFLAVIALFQTLTGDPWAALRVCLLLVAAVLAAGLVTFTTRVSAMLDLFERLARPLAPAGVRPDRVALVLALTVRSVPMVAAAWQESRDACAARGLPAWPHLTVVPVIVGMIRTAEAMGEAMTARGVD